MTLNLKHFALRNPPKWLEVLPSVNRYGSIIKSKKNVTVCWTLSANEEWALWRKAQIIIYIKVKNHNYKYRYKYTIIWTKELKIFLKLSE